MTHKKLLQICCLVASIVLSAGCASTTGASNHRAIASDFADGSLEVLFATEFPVASKDEALAKASLAYRDGDLAKSQFYLVRALKFDITDANILAQIGNLHVLQGNTTLAGRSFNFALEQDPQHAESLEGLGLLYFRTGKEDKARSMLEQAVAIDESLWRAHNALGVIADRERDYERALVHYNRALELNPESDSTLINRGYSMFLNERLREAAVDFYTVAKRSDNSRAWRNLAMVYAVQGWYEDALETYLEVMDPAEAHNEIGAIATRNGDIDAAWHFLGEAVRLSPTYFASAEKNLAELRRRASTAGENSYSGERQSSRLTP